MTSNQSSVIRRQAPGRKRFLLATASCLFVLLAAELVLRGVGRPYGPETLMRKHFVADGSGWMVTRPLFTRIEASAHPQRFRREKETGTMRVALLGGSSVRIMGDLMPLEKVLEGALGKDIQILNFGMSGCGSDRVVVTAREALALDVDVVLIYSGHNEFISQSNRDTYEPSGWLHRNSKVLQLIIGNAWVPEPGRVYSPTEKDAVYEQFDANLRELNRLCGEAGVTLVWSTVPANLRIPPVDCIKRQHGIGEAACVPMSEFKFGAELYNRGDYPQAKQVLQHAIGVSPRPWRVTSRNNRILRETADELGVPLADIEKHVTDASPHGIPAPGLFTDHCHLSQQGYIILVNTFARALIRELQGRPGEGVRVETK